jgi:predicted TIM-barrel fold metal-dependent hydrolase
LSGCATVSPGGASVGRAIETIEYLKRMVGAEHIMVGTDYPFNLGDWMAAEKIQTMNCTESERQAMLHGNARKLLRL